MRGIAVSQEHTAKIWKEAVVKEAVVNEHKTDPHFLGAYLSVLMHCRCRNVLL